MEMAREMTRSNPLVMQGAGRLVANVVGRGFVLDKRATGSRRPATRPRTSCMASSRTNDAGG